MGGTLEALASLCPPPEGLVLPVQPPLPSLPKSRPLLRKPLWIFPFLWFDGLCCFTSLEYNIE